MTQYSIGIDLGGTKVLTAIVEKNTGSIVSFIKKKTKKDKGCEKLVQKIKKSIYDLLEESSVDISQIDNIGIGAAGQIDRENGIIINASNLDFCNYNIKAELEKEFSKEVILGNDVEIATIGELYFGAGKGEKDFVCIFVGTGIGSTIVNDGKIRYGATGTAGEIGHIIVDIDGRTCGCGGCGCLEAYASRLAIEKRITGALKKGRKSDIVNYLIPDKPIKTSMIKKSIENKDDLVMQIINEASEYLACGLASIINFYNPSKIILGGGLIDAIDYFYERAVEMAKIKALPTPSKSIRFEKAKLGDFSGVIGAALLSEYRKDEF
ncbi:MAG: ROK family protein [Candidatus Gastranaerophilales bacterium]|nr:ROK family protein [Candidatus Gastranaerophilales bacterium]